MKRQTRIGFMVAAIAVALYALMWVGYRSHWDWLADLDSTASNSLRDYAVAHPGWVRFWHVFCTVFGPAGARVLGGAVVVIAVLRRNLRAVLFVVATMWLSGVVTRLAKALAQRARPPGALVHAGSTSFPSGHALDVIAAVLALLTLSTGLAGRGVRATTIVAGALIVVAVGVGRIVLVVHYPSDVVAGWALGYLWFWLCLLVIKPSPLAADLTRRAADEKPEAPSTVR